GGGGAGGRGGRGGGGGGGGGRGRGGRGAGRVGRERRAERGRLGGWAEVADRGGGQPAVRRDRQTQVHDRASRPASSARSSRLSTLPVVVRGSASVNSTLFGHLKWASRSRHQAMISPAGTAWPEAGMMTACTASPQVGSGRPSTATSATAGCRASTASTSAG